MRFNPIIEKELKIKMRSWKAPALITVYLVFLGLIIFLNFLGTRLLSPYDYGQFGPSTALNSYNILAVFQLLLVVFITPAMTGSAVSGERERQTLDLLLCTNLSTHSVIIGKIFVSIAYIMLLITASLPILGTVFFYGGIRITDILLLFAFYIVTALALGSIGIFYSTLFKKSSVAMVMSYLTVLFLLFGTVIVYGIWVRIFMRYSTTPVTLAQTMAFMFPNPLYGFGSLTEGMSYNIPFFGDIFRFGFSMYGGSQYAASAPVILGITLKPWMANIGFDIFVSILLILISAYRIKPVKGLWRKKRVKSGELKVESEKTV
ncbi:MAG: ABC transporter permease subunit [Clostridiales bacterium]|jgi:ABC-type transport system involved in multi-copper enzyme maturation permease subunit|nr:ABC transporter permease [Eubacteriales bacterium]MDH7567608.1 ABC transporter permease subunit [Clostridiales bacterium]